MMRHPTTGAARKGFVGFSWTTLFFGFFPPLFRGQLLVALAVAALAIMTGWLSTVAWAFFYNNWFTRQLLQDGYEFSDTPEKTRFALARLGLASDTAPSENALDALSKYAELRSSGALSDAEFATIKARLLQ